MAQVLPGVEAISSLRFARSPGGLACALALAAAVAGCNRTPELLSSHLARGDLALSEGRYAEALIAYAHAHDLAPQDDRVQRGMMRARVSVMADSPGRIGAELLDDVRYEADLLLAADPAHEALYQTALANVLARRGDADGARAKLAEALKADPGSAQAHAALGEIHLGNALRLAGSPAGDEARAQARAELELALKTKPDAFGPLVGLARLDLAAGNAAGAAERLTAALHKGDDFVARMTLGGARIQQQRPADAIEQFQRAVQLDPKSAEALSELGQALLGVGRLDEAEQSLRAAAQIRRDPATSIALGFVLARQKRSEQALGIFGQVLAQDATSASALYGAGMASEELGHTSQALDYYGRLLALAPDARQRQILAELRPDAERRVAALSAKPEGSAAASSKPAARPARP